MTLDYQEFPLLSPSAEGIPPPPKLIHTVTPPPGRLDERGLFSGIVGNNSPKEVSNTMARKSSNGKKPTEPTAKKLTAANVAAYRRAGHTWEETRTHFGIRYGSGKFTAILNEGGYDAGGAKLDGSGPESKATYHGKPQPKAAK